MCNLFQLLLRVILELSQKRTTIGITPGGGRRLKMLWIMWMVKMAVRMERKGMVIE